MLVFLFAATAHAIGPEDLAGAWKVGRTVVLSNCADRKEQAGDVLPVEIWTVAYAGGVLSARPPATVDEQPYTGVFTVEGVAFTRGATDTLTLALLAPGLLRGRELWARQRWVEADRKYSGACAVFYQVEAHRQ